MEQLKLVNISILLSRCRVHISTVEKHGSLGDFRHIKFKNDLDHLPALDDTLVWSVPYGDQCRDFRKNVSAFVRVLNNIKRTSSSDTQYFQRPDVVEGMRKELPVFKND